MFRLTPITQSRLLLALLLIPLIGIAATKSGSTAATDTSLLRFNNKLHAITLTTSNIAPSTEDMRAAYPDLIVYHTHAKSAGSRLFYLRLGFFANKDEARATLATVRSWYPDAFVTQITRLEQVTALGVDLDTLALKAARQAAREQTRAAPPPATTAAGYALHLDSASNPQFTTARLPAALKGYHLYVQRLTSTKGVEFHLNLGVFADRKSAEQARDKLRAQYPLIALREISAREQGQVAALPAQPAPAISAKPSVPNIAVKPPVPVMAAKMAPTVAAAKPIEREVAPRPVVSAVAVKPAPPVEAEKPALSVVAKSDLPEVAAQPATPVVMAKPAAASGGDPERQAQELLDQAQDQIIARQFDAAVKTLSEILKLPKNTRTADAMEYTGLAYDQAGKVQQAIQHYQKYLSLYPDNRSVYRIRQRLQILQKG